MTSTPQFDPTTGNTFPEYDGFTFLDKQWWINEQGNQDRSNFTLGTGTLAVADGDAYADRVHIDPNQMTVWLTTPAISTAGIDPSTLHLTFDSSFRPEAAGEFAEVDESFDGGNTWTQIFRRDRRVPAESAARTTSTRPSTWPSAGPVARSGVPSSSGTATTTPATTGGGRSTTSR